MKQLLTVGILAMTLVACNHAGNENANPLISQPNTPYGVPAFDQIKIQHYLPAFEAAIAEQKAEVEADGNGKVTVEVANTGKMDGTEVVQLYIRNLQDPNGPLKSLRAFERVDVKAGQTSTVTLSLNRKSFEFWDAETNTMRVKPGKYEILVGTSSVDQGLKRMEVEVKN